MFMLRWKGKYPPDFVLQFFWFFLSKDGNHSAAMTCHSIVQVSKLCNTSPSPLSLSSFLSLYCRKHFTFHTFFIHSSLSFFFSSFSLFFICISIYPSLSHFLCLFLTILLSHLLFSFSHLLTISLPTSLFLPLFSLCFTSFKQTWFV